MNATAPADPDFIEVTDYLNGSDSDTNIDEDEVAGEYYQPVSAVDSEDEDQSRNDTVSIHPQQHQQQVLSNGVTVNQVQRGISSLRLNDNLEGTNNHNMSMSSEDEEDKEEEEEEEASDSAIMRAFREDENRRNAPLPPENATRVREAMRGISFAGTPPPWADRVPEGNLIDRIHQLRRPV
ncbi:unnamed protein product [Prunus armeniaca]|uniref:Uncharacterized protein n=1 Tax=Prunus armeniaca TaxID=36596 RepID=A0A6J5XIW9_PRUAR|nr:unnamed protein product [Prunus armeniaca]